MTPKKVLFIYPNPSTTPAIPTAIAILNGLAKNLSWTTEYFDTCDYQKINDNLNDRESSGEFKPSEHLPPVALKSLDQLIADLQDKIDSGKPDIVAVSCISFEYEFLLTFFHRIHFPPEMIVVIGGIHATIEPDKVIETGLFDMVCTGEGEETFPEILINFEKNESMTNIKNTYFKNRNDSVVIKNSRRRLLDENMLWKISPDYSFFDERYFLYPFNGKLYKRFGFEFARGCPYDCSYCGNTALKSANKKLGKFVRLRAMEDIKDEMRKMVDVYGIELFYLKDECFLSHSFKWLKELVEWYGREIRKPFILQTRPETVTEEKVKLLTKMNAPFFQVSVGVESGSEKILFEVCNRKTKISDRASCKNVGMFFGKGGFLFTTMEFLRCFPEKIQEMGKISFKGGIFPEKRA